MVETSGSNSDDPYLWLEEVDGETALAWVRSESALCLEELEGDQRFQVIYDDAKRTLTAPERIPYVVHKNGQVHNFWQDGENVRGVLRATALESYYSSAPAWETVLDIDELARDEGEDWVYSGRTWLEPDNDRFMISLSRGGSDAVVLREFDLSTKAFVEGGFFLPEGKQSVSWLDRDRLLVTTGHGGGGLNTSGYPRTARIWQRGSSIEDADVILSAPEDDAMLYSYVSTRPEGQAAFVIRFPDFFTQVIHHVGDDGRAVALPLPLHVNLECAFHGRLVFALRRDWSVDGETLKSGAVIAASLDGLIAGCVAAIETIASAPVSGSIERVSALRDSLLVSRIEDVTGKISRVTPIADGWSAEPVSIPEGGALEVSASDSFADLAFVNFAGYLTPPTLFLLRDGAEVTPVKQLPEQFDASAFAVTQHFATSADGTQVPYFMICRRDIQMSADTPTVLYGYGGFEASMTPNYAGPYVQTWLESGGAWVVANIRGGGEYGPNWHQAALKENRQRAFDDFIGVAEDLIARGVTSPRRLGIYGGSNGGLLVGAVMVQRPDLFHTVACAVPLLDMLRYHKLLAGASWIGEYGDPDVPAERGYIEKYSPYQNVQPDTRYPKVFFFTSTKDDRVHPGHARKMAAKMKDQGHDILYYENVDGGHSSAADQIERARRSAQLAIFSLRELADT